MARIGMPSVTRLWKIGIVEKINGNMKLTSHERNSKIVHQKSVIEWRKVQLLWTESIPLVNHIMEVGLNILIATKRPLQVEAGTC